MLSVGFTECVDPPYASTTNYMKPDALQSLRAQIYLVTAHPRWPMILLLDAHLNGFQQIVFHTQLITLMFKSIECRTAFGLHTVMNTMESGLQALASGSPHGTLKTSLCLFYISRTLYIIWEYSVTATFPSVHLVQSGCSNFLFVVLSNYATNLWL